MKKLTVTLIGSTTDDGELIPKLDILMSHENKVGKKYSSDRFMGIVIFINALNISKVYPPLKSFLLKELKLLIHHFRSSIMTLLCPR